MGKETVKNKGTKNNLPLRLNMIFLVVFLAFAGLIVRLGYVQIVNGAHYKKIMHANHTQTANIDSARGKIVDVNGTPLADNNAELAVVYIRHAGMSDSDNLKIAQKLSKLITLDKTSVGQIADRDRRDYYILTHYKTLQKAYNAYLSKSEQTKLQDHPANEYKVLLSRVSKKVLRGYSNSDQQIMAIMHQFNQASNLNPHIIKRGLSVNDKEYVNVVDHLNEFDGTIQTADVSSRKYIKNKPFYVGKVGDIPVDEINNYLAKGYSRNALVGVSNIEDQYESYLRGVPMKMVYRTKKGVPVGNPAIKGGQRGDDVQLTIDDRLQKQVDKILEANILSARSMPGNAGNNSAYAVAINPRTGAILAIGGKIYQNGKFIDAGSEALNSQFAMGSAVKGATELTGYRYNAVPEQFRDMRIKLPTGAGQKARYFQSWEVGGLGSLTPEQALQFSSNVFMAKIASNLAGITLTPSGGEYVGSFPGPHSPRFVKAVNEMRNGYAEVGLGVKTGIDLPTEGTGYNGGMPDNSGLIQQFAIGQFDTYTPLEMAQYISTIANGGYRIQPHLLQSIHAPSDDPENLGRTIYSFKTHVLNTVKNTPNDIKRVQKGLYLVTHGSNRLSTGFDLGHAPNLKYKIAAKTGTAQISQTDLTLYNETLVSYAPYDNPQIAVIDVVPRVRVGHQNHQIALSIYKAYDKLYHYTSKN
ncbi:MAG: peptidoglycan D,D-transpeptidase FtsI family protein [Sporolactobacillus sp.]